MISSTRISTYAKPMLGIVTGARPKPMTFGSNDVSPTAQDEFKPTRRTPTPEEIVQMEEAASSGHVSALQGLTRRRLDFNAPNQYKTPVGLALLGKIISQHPANFPEALKILKEGGLALDTRDQHNATIAHYLVNTPNRYTPQNLDYLKTLGGDFKFADDDGNTPFHRAVYITDFPRRHPRKWARSTVDWFIRNKQTVDTLNQRRETPLFLAAAADPVTLRKLRPDLTPYQARHIVTVLGDYNMRYPVQSKQSLDRIDLLKGVIEVAKNSKANGNVWLRLGESLTGFTRTQPPYMTREILAYVNAYGGFNIKELRGDGLD